MKHSVSCFAVLLLSLLLVLCGCNGAKQTTLDSDTKTACVYYINLSDYELVAENVTPPDGTEKKQLRFMIEALGNPPANKRSPLPEGTKLLSVSLSDGIATVDFSGEFYNGEDAARTLAPAAIAQTLCSLDFVSGVQILVEGSETVGVDKRPIGIMRESDLIVDEGSRQATPPKTTVTLYFADENAEYLTPERRNITILSSETIEKVIVEELIKGPTEGGHSATIPQGTKLLSLETKNNVCFVNFSKSFIEKHSGGTSAEALTIYSIVNSLTELSGIDRVQFLIEGEKKEEFFEFIFNEPFLPDKSLIKQ